MVRLPRPLPTRPTAHPSLDPPSSWRSTTPQRPCHGRSRRWPVVQCPTTPGSRAAQRGVVVAPIPAHLLACNARRRPNRLALPRTGPLGAAWLVGPVSVAEVVCRTSFSFHEGASTPEEIVNQAASLGLSAVAITDRDGVCGIPRAHKAAKAAGVPHLARSPTHHSRRSRCRSARARPWGLVSAHAADHGGPIRHEEGLWTAPPGFAARARRWAGGHPARRLVYRACLSSPRSLRRTRLARTHATPRQPRPLPLGPRCAALSARTDPARRHLRCPHACPEPTPLTGRPDLHPTQVHHRSSLGPR